MRVRYPNNPSSRTLIYCRVYRSPLKSDAKKASWTSPGCFTSFSRVVPQHTPPCAYTFPYGKQANALSVLVVLRRVSIPALITHNWDLVNFRALNDTAQSNGGNVTEKS